MEVSDFEFLSVDFEMQHQAPKVKNFLGGFNWIKTKYFCKDAPGVDGGLADDSMSLTNLPLWPDFLSSWVYVQKE